MMSPGQRGDWKFHNGIRDNICFSKPLFQQCDPNYSSSRLQWQTDGALRVFVYTQSVFFPIQESRNLKSYSGKLFLCILHTNPVFKADGYRGCLLEGKTTGPWRCVYIAQCSVTYQRWLHFNLSSMSSFAIYLTTQCNTCYWGKVFRIDQDCHSVASNLLPGIRLETNNRVMS